MALNISRGIIAKPQKVVIYGPEGVGKTTLAAQFPNPLFIDLEGSTEHYDVARTSRPLSWTELLAQVQDVKKERPCTTLVIDTADWAERLAIYHVCQKMQCKSIEDPGYGKGYTVVVEEFGKLINLLSDVCDAGMNVVLNCHAAVRKFDQPDEAASYNRWALALIDAAKMSNSAKVKEWADAVLFANYETVVEVVGDGRGTKGKARGGQKRVLHTQHHAVWDAKNRWGLPDEVPMSFDAFAAHIPAEPPAQAAPANPTQAAPMPPAPVASIPEPQEPKPAPKPLQQLVFNQDGTRSDLSASSNTTTKDKKTPQQDKSMGTLPPYFDPLLNLMKNYGVTFEEIKEVVVGKGYFTSDTPVKNYPQDFVEGVLIAAWPQVHEQINANVPFN